MLGKGFRLLHGPWFLLVFGPVKEFIFEPKFVVMSCSVLEMGFGPLHGPAGLLVFDPGSDINLVQNF